MDVVGYWWWVSMIIRVSEVEDQRSVIIIPSVLASWSPCIAFHNHMSGRNDSRQSVCHIEWKCWYEFKNKVQELNEEEVLGQLIVEQGHCRSWLTEHDTHEYDDHDHRKSDLVGLVLRSNYCQEKEWAADYGLVVCKEDVEYYGQRGVCPELKLEYIATYDH